MRYFPINLDLHGRNAVVIGGGVVAARKCRALLDAGSFVTVVSPELIGELLQMREQAKIDHCARQYATGDLDRAFIVFAATCDRSVNRRVAEDARALGIPVNVADAPADSDFTLPAVLAQGDLLIAVSTSGKSPSVAAAVRDEIADLIGEEYAETLELITGLREKLLTAKSDNAYNKQILSEAARLLPSMVRNGRYDEIDRLFTRYLAGPFPAKSGAGAKDPE